MRSRLEWKRWRSRVVLGIMVLTLLILAGVSIYTFRAYQNAAAGLAVESNRQLTYVGAARLKDELTRFSDELHDLVRVRQIYAGRTTDQAQALEAARNRLTIFDGGVVLLDNFGQVRASEPPRPEIQGADWSDRDFFRQLLVGSREFYSDITDDGPDQAPVVVISVPIIGDRGEFVGALAGMFRLGESHISSLYASIVRLRIGQRGDLYVLDRARRILYDSGYNRVGQTLETPWQNTDDIRGTALRMRDPDGNDIIAAFAPVPGTGWTLVSEDDWTAATGATQRYARSLLLLLALGTVLPALGVALLVRTQNAEILERERNVQERRIAWMIQERLLPQAVPMLPGWNLGLYYRPDRSSGGDFYDFNVLPDGRLMITLGHVDAKGLDAAHVIDTVRAALRGAAQMDLPAHEALAYCNQLACPELRDERCVSILYAVLGSSNGQVSYASANAPAPWLCGSDIAADEIAAEGTSLGTSPDARFQQRFLVIPPGGCAVIFSPGLFQPRRSGKEPFNLSALQEIVCEPGRDADDMVEVLGAQFKSGTATRGTPPHDLTVIILQRHAGESPRGGTRTPCRPAHEGASQDAAPEGD